MSDEAQPGPYRDSNANWQEIQEIKERLRNIDAFDQDVCGLPLLIKEVKEQKPQLDAIGCSLPLLTDRVTKAEGDFGGVYQKVLDMEDYLKLVDKLEAQSLQNMEMQLKLGAVMGNMGHHN